MTAKRKFRATVTVELEAPSRDDISDILHQVWADGDPEDTHNACIVLERATEVEQFSWQMPAGGEA